MTQATVNTGSGVRTEVVAVVVVVVAVGGRVVDAASTAPALGSKRNTVRSTIMRLDPKNWVR